MARFRDNVVLITGAGRGIGRAMALRFAQEGAHIVAADIEPALAESTAAAVQELGRQCLGLQVDVTQQSDIQRMVARPSSTSSASMCCATMPVCCGSRICSTSPRPTGISSWMSTPKASFSSCRLWRAKWSNAAAARSSIPPRSLASNPSRTSSHYGVSKAGVIHMTKSAAAVLAPYNINVNAVCPGTTITDMSLMATAEARQTDGGIGRRGHQGAEAQIPIGRRNQPDDIAAMAASWPRRTPIRSPGRRSTSMADW